MKQPQDQLPELIDCCRSQSDDLTLPEMQPLAAAIQSDPEWQQRLQKSRRIDSLIGQSLRDVVIPPGLEDRLLACVLPSSPPTALDGKSQEIDRSAASVAKVSEGAVAPRKLMRNRWQVWTAVAASLLAVAGIAFLAMHETVPSLATQREVASHADQWLNSLVESDWADDRLPLEFPLPTQPQLAVYRWQLVSSRSSALKVVCYNISSSQPTHLFVCLGSRATELPTTLPQAPYQLGSGWLVGGWQGDNGVVYVLAVKGTQPQFKALLQRNQKVASIARWKTLA